MGLKLKYIDIQNFQAYKRARIPLSDFTIVVGAVQLREDHYFQGDAVPALRRVGRHLP